MGELEVFGAHAELSLAVRELLLDANVETLELLVLITDIAGKLRSRTSALHFLV